MYTMQLVLVLLVGCLINTNYGKHVNTKIPSFLKICHRSDPRLSDCIKDSVELLKPMLVKGIPEFGIPSVEPLLIPEIVLDEGAGAISVKSTYRDIKIFGPSDFVIKSIKIDQDRNRVRIKLWFPSLQLVGMYTMEGRILLMPISGSGVCRGNYTNIDAIATMQGEKIRLDGKEYFNITDFEVDFNIGHASIRMEDLFGGNKQLGDAMNLFLNDNWKGIANEMKPILEDKLADLFMKFSNKIYHKYPLDTLLPP